MNLSEKLSKIQSEFKSKKSRFNSFGKYNYRSAEDILEALKPFNKKYDVYFLISEDVVHGSVIVSEASICDYENNTITARAIVGVDLNTKGQQTPQQYGAASSYAKKYALGNLLLIDDTADADATNRHDKVSKLPMTSKQLEDAKSYMKKGGSLDAIKNKYSVSKHQEDLLLTL